MARKTYKFYMYHVIKYCVYVCLVHIIYLLFIIKGRRLSLLARALNPLKVKWIIIIIIKMILTIFLPQRKEHKMWQCF